MWRDAAHLELNICLGSVVVVVVGSSLSGFSLRLCARLLVLPPFESSLLLPFLLPPAATKDPDLRESALALTASFTIHMSIASVTAVMMCFISCVFAGRYDIPLIISSIIFSGSFSYVVLVSGGFGVVFVVFG